MHFRALASLNWKRKPISIELDRRSILQLTICGQINLLRQFADVHIETILYFVKYLGIVLVRNKGNGQSLGTEATSTGHAMQVGVGILGHIVVEHNVNSLNVHAATKEVGGHQNALLEILKLLVAVQTFLLGHATMDADSGKILFRQQLGQSHATLYGFHKDYHLKNEFVLIKQFVRIK